MTYIYDGTYPGMLSCVFESFSAHEIPDTVLLPGNLQLSLFGHKEISTDLPKSRRVEAGIEKKLGHKARILIERVYCSCSPEKERDVIRFLHFGFREGPDVLGMLAHPLVHPLYKAQRSLLNEAHLLKEFVRFSERQGVLMSVIDPKSCVLPFMAEHFAVRLRSERFLIHDRTHDLVLAGDQGRTRLLPAAGFFMPDTEREEEIYQAMWKMYYDTIAVEQRKNLRLRMTHMPKRYWGNMTEFLTEPGRLRELLAEELPE